MKPRLTTFLTINRSHARSGVTLVEVMVSMVIMSIGIILLATLLPISILRTAQATQLTQAVFVKNNAQAIVESNPWFLDNTTLEPKNVIFQNTTNNITYAVIDPLGYSLVGSTIGQSLTRGLQTLVQPRFSGFPPLTIPTLIQTASLAQLPDSWSLVVEGSVTPNLLSVPPNVQYIGSTITGLNVRNSVNPTAAQHRLVMYDTTGKVAVIEPLSNVTANNLSWIDPNGTGPSLPVGFTPARARVEVMQRRFTWMMTVKKDQLNPLDSSWSAEVDVAVFYNRAFSTNDEIPYTFVAPMTGVTGYVSGTGFDGAAGVRNVDDDNNGTVDWTTPNTVPDPDEVGWPGSDDNRTVTIQYNPTGQIPALKKGGFMLEPSNLEWYRIVNLQVRPQNATLTYVDLLLDRDLRYTNATPIVPVLPTVNGGIFMKGVVDVYPLATVYGQN